MTDQSEATSTTRQIAPLAIVLGIPLIFAAMFFYSSPVILETGGPQGIFKCGSPNSPNVDAKNVCSDPEKVARNKAIYSALSGAALVGLGAVWMLRGQREEEDWDETDRRPRRRRDDDIDLRADVHDADDPVRGSDRERRRGLRGVDREHGRDDGPEHEIEEDRPPRRRERRSVLRDDDFDPEPPRRRTDDFVDPEPRRRDDDDWSSDGWR